MGGQVRFDGVMLTPLSQKLPQPVLILGFVGKVIFPPDFALVLMHVTNPGSGNYVNLDFLVQKQQNTQYSIIFDN